MADEEEISLVDLFAVLIKWRRVLLAIPALTFIIAGLILFGGPAVGLYSFKKSTVELSMTQTQLPPAIRAELPINVEQLAITYVTDVIKLGELIKKHNVIEDADISDMDESTFRTYISEDFLRTVYSASNAGGRIIFRMNTKKPKEATLFLQEIAEYMNTRISGDILDRTKIIAQSMSALYKEIPNATTLSDASKQLIVSSRIFMEKNEKVFSALTEPVILNSKQGRGKTLATVVIASFFASVMLAFLLEAIVRVRNDPVAMEKLSAAYNANRRLAK